MARDFSRTVRRLGSPTAWSVTARRAFVLTSPVSAPAWLIILLGANVALAVGKVWHPLASFWNAPPKRLSSNSYADYRSRPQRSGKVVDLPLPDTARDAA